MNAALLTLALCFTPGAASEEVLLWPKGAPGALGTAKEDVPRLLVYPAPGGKSATDKKPAPAVVICPGGGYGHLAMSHEGTEIAEWLNKQGFTAFILQYRIAPRYHHPAPMQDVQRALRLVRARATPWNVDPRHIGIWGFSAGGHLASTAATHFDEGKKDADDPIERVSCRPDFAILSYPVITMKRPFTHGGSRDNLLGKQPSEELVKSLSNDEQVTAKTPPTFLFHTTEDTAVPPENSIRFYLALRKAGVPAELHIYEKGRHGVGLASKDPVLSSWPARLADWLKRQTATK